MANYDKNYTKVQLIPTSQKSHLRRKQPLKPGLQEIHLKGISN